jgi:CTP:molybdopterin cytidylyltransferase MocA
MAAGVDVVPLVDLARALGWRITVWDAAARFETRRRFAGADRRVTDPAAALRAAVDRAVDPVAVVMGHDLRRDGEALAMLLGSRARYIGVLGPRRRTDRLLAEMASAAIPASLHAPAGLSLGGETPAEIALSIVAEIQAVLASETVGHLRDRQGPIHARVRPVYAAVLAAGASRRFGGAKQLASVDGTPMLRRVAEATCRSACARVGVVLGARADAIAPVIDGLPLDRIDNAGWTEGMASSIRAAVGWARARGAGALLLAVGDQPALDAAHLDALVAASNSGQRLAASRYANVLGPPAVFPERYFTRLEALNGDVGARSLLREAAAEVATVDWPQGAEDLDNALDDARSLPVSGYTTPR